jgi:hypothetical protein
MKVLKAIGLAALVITAMTVVVGAGTASATTLCEENSNPCPETKAYPENTTIIGEKLEGSTTEFKVTNATGTVFTVFCNEAKFKMTSGKNNGPEKMLNGKMSTFEFPKCERTKLGDGCASGIGFNLPYNVELLGNPFSLGNGIIWLVNGGAGKPSVKLIDCGIKLATCNYTVDGEFKGAFSGGTVATVSFEKIKLKSDGANQLCGEWAEFKVTYAVGSPILLFLEPKW